MSLANQAERIVFDTDAREGAVDIDLHCALAFGRAALRALAVLSDEAAMTVDDCMAEEQGAIGLSSLETDLAGMTIQDMRTTLRSHRDEAERTRVLVHRLIFAANAVELKCAND